MGCAWPIPVPDHTASIFCVCPRGLRKFSDSGANFGCSENIPCYSWRYVNTYLFHSYRKRLFPPSGIFCTWLSTGFAKASKNILPASRQAARHGRSPFQGIGERAIRYRCSKASGSEPSGIAVPECQGIVRQGNGAGLFQRGRGVKFFEVPALFGA